MIYERIAVGDSFVLGSHRFTAEAIKRFAGAFDPQGFHTDEDAAAKTHFGALCASGWHTAAVMTRLYVDHLRREAEAAAARGEPAGRVGPSPGFDNLRWLKPVYAGDTITYTARIVARRPSQSKPGWGIVSIEITGAKDNGELAFAVTAHVFVALAEGGEAPL